MVVTELGVFEVDRKGSGVRLVQLAPGVTVEEVTAKTEATFTTALA
jgi:3-oxoacid CoA-transferase subunit B